MSNPNADRQLEQTPSQEPKVRAKAERAGEQGTHQGPYYEPAVDIYETEDALTLVADLPGVLPEQVETDIRDSLLTITARLSPLESRWKPMYREFSEGHYLRQFRLGHQIDQTKVSATLKDGVLTLTLPKSDKARPRRIEVLAE